MPGKGKIPSFVEHVATAIKKSNPKLNAVSALKIAIKQLQRYGYLKEGSLKLTEKGRERSRVHYKRKMEIDWRKFRKMLRSTNRRSKLAEALKRRK